MAKVSQYIVSLTPYHDAYRTAIFLPIHPSRNCKKKKKKIIPIEINLPVGAAVLYSDNF